MPSVTVLLTICAVLIFTSFTQFAEGATLNFPLPGCPVHITPGDAQAGAPYQFFYDDSSNPVFTTNNKTDTVTINVNSTSNPAGVPLVLTETGPNDGTFTNTNFVFTEGGDNIFPLERVVTITLAESAGTDPLNVRVRSDSDTTGLLVPFHLSGTNATTKFFSANVLFTAGPSSGNSIHAQSGDIVTAIDPLSGYASSGLISTSDPTIGALQVKFNDIVTISLNGVSCTAIVDDELGVPGGGGGGLVVRPGFVLDALAALSAIGGSPFIVTPPSFGGGFFHYSDGLTIVKPDEKHVFDISKYNQNIEDQVLSAGQPVNMTFKMFDPYNINAIIHSGLYFITKSSDMITPNSIASIVYDKGSKLEINDPTNMLSKATIIPSTDGKFQYFTFHFVPTRSYEKMSFLDRSWNDHRYSTDVRFHDAGISQPKTDVMPAGITKYDNFKDLISLIEKDGFKKPHIMAHIHNAADVFSSDEGGYVYWLHDSITHAVTLVISDNEKNTLYSFTESLIPNEIQPKGDYGFMKFTTKQLYRLVDSDEEQKVMEQEEIKAIQNTSIYEHH
ncbi:MAG TPA: hypothetical protein VEU72_06170 [Nitrosopumilaceae archaeon]|nr:hypothetical protein [Nitrosopumilaceae archaeon]